MKRMLAWWKAAAALLVALRSAVLAQQQLKEWCYRDKGYECAKPTEWSKKFADCSGKSQSPIDIRHDDDAVVKQQTYKEPDEGIRFRDYDKVVRDCKAVNNGHTVTINIPSEHDDEPSPGFEAGHLPEKKYKLVQFHFHWGSEHNLNGTQYPLELHLVHVNEETKQIEAVIGVFYRLSDDDVNPADKRIGDATMDNLVSLLPKLIRTNTTTTSGLSEIRPADLLPSNTRDYISYNGSLTTPPCTENIQWMIFTEFKNISPIQLQQFQSLLSDDGRPIGANYRPIQSINDRKITFYTFNAAASGSRDSLSLIIVIVIAVIITIASLGR